MNYTGISDTLRTVLYEARRIATFGYNQNEIGIEHIMLAILRTKEESDDIGLTIIEAISQKKGEEIALDLEKMLDYSEQYESVYSGYLSARSEEIMQFANERKGLYKKLTTHDVIDSILFNGDSTAAILLNSLGIYCSNFSMKVAQHNVESSVDNNSNLFDYFLKTNGMYFESFIVANPEFDTDEFTKFVVKHNKAGRTEKEIGDIAKHEILRLASEYTELKLRKGLDDHSTSTPSRTQLNENALRPSGGKLG